MVQTTAQDTPEKAAAVQRAMSIYHTIIAELCPQPLVFFKPLENGNGVAAKFNMKFKPEYEVADSGEYFIKKLNGGVFVDLVKQGPKRGDNWTFLWTDTASLITAKLGREDMAKLAVALEDFRGRGILVPNYMRSEKGGENTVALLHKPQGRKTAKGISTSIAYRIEDEGGKFRIGKSKDHWRAISLQLHEEYTFRKFLDQALRVVIKLGAR